MQDFLRIAEDVQHGFCDALNEDTLATRKTQRQALDRCACRVCREKDNEQSVALLRVTPASAVSSPQDQ